MKLPQAANVLPPRAVKMLVESSRLAQPVHLDNTIRMVRKLFPSHFKKEQP